MDDGFRDGGWGGVGNGGDGGGYAGLEGDRRGDLGGEDWSSDLSEGGGVSYWGSDFGGNDGRSGVNDWSGGYEGFAVDDSVETVDRVGGVFNDATGAISVDEEISALYEISVADLLMSLAVSGDGVLGR